MYEAPWAPPRLGPADPASPKYSLAAQYAKMSVSSSWAPSQPQSAQPQSANTQLPCVLRRTTSDGSLTSTDQRRQRIRRTASSSTPGSGPRPVSNACNAGNSDAAARSKSSSRAGGARPSSSSSGKQVSDRSSRQQLVRSASQLLQDQQLRTERAQQSLQLKNQQALRYFARANGMLFPEVKRYKQVFDKHESEGSIGKQQFEQLLYGCTASPQRTLLPQSKVEELWQIANSEDQFLGIDFQDVCTFFKGHVDECIGGLQYDGVGPAKATFP